MPVISGRGGEGGRREVISGAAHSSSQRKRGEVATVGPKKGRRPYH